MRGVSFEPKKKVSLQSKQQGHEKNRDRHGRKQRPQDTAYRDQIIVDEYAGERRIDDIRKDDKSPVNKAKLSPISNPETPAQRGDETRFIASWLKLAPGFNDQATPVKEPPILPS